MRLNSIHGKLSQLRHAHPSLWLPFLSGWLKRRRNGFVPCVIEGSRQLLQIPLRDFYESYVFFVEDPNGRAELRFFLCKLKLTEMLYDIGGFRGAYSAAVKAKAGTNTVVPIFEPLAKNTEAIRRICGLNHFDRDSGYKILLYDDFKSPNAKISCHV